MDRLLFACSLISVFIQGHLSSSEHHSFKVSCDKNVAELKHFWRSTGLCPAAPHQEDYSYFLSEDEKQNLALIGSVPRDGIKQVRIHWLLDLVKINSIEGSIINYNFTLLDQLVDLLHSNGLQPGFELMGNPSDWYNDFENRTQIFAWRDLVQLIAKRYVDRYGLSQVAEWNFESWNEPDHGDFDNLNFTVQGFLNYYDACSEGLKAAHPSLKLGGPADSCKEPSKEQPVKKSWALMDLYYIPPFLKLGGPADSCKEPSREQPVKKSFLNYYDACSEGLKAGHPSLKLGGPADSCREPTTKQLVKKSWALMDHCVNGMNYFTKEKGVRLDYISLHLKGGGASLSILTQELAKIKEIQLKHPSLTTTPFYNDEADPLVTWSRPEWWRADAAYAAIVAKIILQHQNKMIREHTNISYELLSNDNGFLNWHPNYFDQRTLVTRFQMNETKPPSIQTIKKPVLSIMGLLSLLGEQQVEVDDLSYRVKEGAVSDGDVGVLATIHTPTQSGGADSWQASILIHNSADTDNVTGTDSIQLEVGGVNPALTTNVADLAGDLVYVEYLLDNAHGNPSAFWRKYDSPVYPTRQQFKEMRQNQEPVRIVGPKTFTPPSMTFSISLNKPGVILVHICAKSASAPEKVTGLRLHQYTASDVLVIWDDSNITTRCILTYEAEYSSTGSEGTYKRINTVDLIFTAFVYSPDQEKKGASSLISGWYRVRAVDYWNRAGLYSNPIQLQTQTPFT
ncbi:alpha-L-iduronidase [Strongylocentrotus purpuratus]|uniref:Alpha-L-iduronidase n=1 Tax=Strongylocentrotus purpuratus TaxID=7668 RepID=A0A7M7NWA1_STRPU|nr:alpha-L-iduronidase [Strongylocentrotus purpuratus]